MSKLKTLDLEELVDEIILILSYILCVLLMLLSNRIYFVYGLLLFILNTIHLIKKNIKKKRVC